METVAAWRTWFDATFARLATFHRSLFYGHSNVPMGVSFHPANSVSDLQRELAVAYGRIQELVSNLFVFFYFLFLYLHTSSCNADGCY